MRRFLLAWTLASLLLPAAVSAQATDAATAPPPVKAPYVAIADEFATAVVYVPSKQQFIFDFKGDMPRTAASLTKLVTGLALLKIGPAWGRTVAISSRDEVGGGRLRVSPGARLSIRDLWCAALGSSANNAAMALARVTGLSRATFVKRMDAAARSAGATRSQFVEPSGMEPTNLTTARDMARIADAAFRDPMMRMATTRATYHIAVNGEPLPRTLTTTLAPFILAPDLWTLGGKTGYLEESQYNLVARLRDVDVDGKPLEGTDVIVVVMGAPTKQGSFDSVKRLAEWAWDNYAF